VGPETRDICYATQNRQMAVKELCKLVDVLLVVGSSHSSNSNRLRETGTDAGVPSYLIENGSELNTKWVEDASCDGVTSGSSVPEAMIETVIDSLRQVAPVHVTQMVGRAETIEFRLPPILTG
jgi:4-hydroxy-3-methylbut-2-en-1-yl diphosphate reductase